jgi:hypothetical protein
MGLDYDGAGVVWIASPVPEAALEEGLRANRWKLMSPGQAAALTPGERMPLQLELELEGFNLIPAPGGEGVSGLVWCGDSHWTTILWTLDEFAACAPGAQATVIGYINGLGAELYSSHVFYDVECGFERTGEYTVQPGKTWVYEPRPFTAVLASPAGPKPAETAPAPARCQGGTTACTIKPRWRVRRLGPGGHVWQYACSRHLAQLCLAFPEDAELHLERITT